MARDIKQLHPRLQKIIPKLIEECKKQGINIKISECFRTVEEQNALYAKGRTKPGNIVTNAKGSSYSSMHQWGVAFDFYLDMDIDKDGKKSDDAFNNAKKTFNKVGKIGKKLGLEWGGDWKSIVDLPHFQLPDWGSTTSNLKKKYGTPDKFKKTWTAKEKKAEKKKAASKKPTIKRGSKGADVETWQKFLKKEGYLKSKVDGDFGKDTEAGTKKFQKKKKLVVDGIVGAKTWKAAGI